MTDADRGWMSVGRCPTWLAGHIGVSSHTVQKKKQSYDYIMELEGISCGVAQAQSSFQTEPFSP